LINVCVCVHVLAIWAKYAQKLLFDYTWMWYITRHKP